MRREFAWVVRTITLGLLMLSFGASAQNSPRRVLLNGEAIDDIRDVSLVDVRVTIDSDGTIRLQHPDYEVVRKPGMRPQIVRRARGLDQAVYLVAEVSGARPAGTRLEVYADGQRLAVVDGTQGREVFEVGKYLRSGKNTLEIRRIAVGGNGSNPNSVVSLTLGFGQATKNAQKGRTLAIDRILFRWSGRAMDPGPARTRHPVVIR